MEQGLSKGRISESRGVTRTIYLSTCSGALFFDYAVYIQCSLIFVSPQSNVWGSVSITAIVLGLPLYNTYRRSREFDPGRGQGITIGALPDGWL